MLLGQMVEEMCSNIQTIRNKMNWKKTIIQLLGGYTGEEYEKVFLASETCNSQLANKRDFVKQWEVQHEADREYILKLKDIIKIDGEEKERLAGEIQSQYFEIQSLKPNIEDVNNDTYFKKTVKYKRWKPGQNIRLRKTLADFSQDSEYLSKYKAWLDSINVKNFDNVDKLIYETTKKVLKFVDGKYKTDLKAHGTLEYWLSPQEAFDYYVTQNKYEDCDGVRSLLYGSLVTKLLENGFQSERWRLKGISIRIEGSGGHAILSWIKSNLVWAPIETTFAPDSWIKDWNRDCDVFKAMYGNVYNIYDEESEYKLK